MPIPTDAGRPGDVWRLRSEDVLVVVEASTDRLFAYRPVSTPDGPSFGIGRRDWDRTLRRVREDRSSLQPGDIAHVFVPEMDVYIIDIQASPRKPSGFGWFAWRVGETPTPEIEDSGLFFDPSSDWNLDGELHYRPFQMLTNSERVIDANGEQWNFVAPFSFRNGQEREGSPAWPLTIPGEPERTESLNRTSEDHEKTQWAAQAGVGPEVFELAWSD